MVQVLNCQQHFNLMKFIKNFILILIFILPISNSFGAMHTFLQKAAVTDGTNNDPSGVHFNPAGTKMFILSQSPDGQHNNIDGIYSHVSEYNLSIPFDVSSTLNNQDVLKPNTIDEAMVSLSRIF